MQTNDFQIRLILFIITLFIIFLIIIIILITHLYQAKQVKYFQSTNELRIIHQNEILEMRLETQEETYQHVSKEIHDNIGQKLTLAKLLLIQAKDSLDRAKIENVENLISETLTDLRELSKLFNNDFVLSDGLIKAIEYEILLLEKLGKFKIQFDVNQFTNFVDKNIELVAFRISQEALSNIIKHSHASKITIILNYRPDYLELTIADNGQGVEVVDTNSKAGLGIKNMRARTQKLNGTFEISGSRENGTIVKAKLPTTYAN